MKRLFLIGINLLLAAHIHAQFIPILLRYDNIETYTWAGAWLIAANSGYYTNASVSPNASAVTFGVGNSSSRTEEDLYFLPNVTGLDATRSHLFKFRLASYRFSSLNSTRGVDAGDYMEVRISTNGGASYTSEIRITGFSNAYWNYNTNASITKTANGTNVTYSPAAGGDRTNTGDGYSVIELTIPAGATQLAVDLYFRTNSAGEEWWIDNMELYRLEPDVFLPVELISFDGEQIDNGISLNWKTAQEINNSHFIVERSRDGVDWDSIGVELAMAGNSGANYSFFDTRPFSGTNYYRLIQVDIDGSQKTFNTIAVDYKLFNIESYVYQQNNILYLKNCDLYQRFKLMDSSGKIIMDQDFNSQYHVDVSNLSSGIYYLNLIGENLVTTTLKVQIFF
jgi:hypothetical protein